MRSDLEAKLRGLYREPMSGQQAHLQAHEDELVAAVSRRAAPGAGGSVGRGRGWPGWLRMPRFALAGVLGVAVAVGACVMPSEYPVSLGYGFEITLAADRFDEIDPHAIASQLRNDLDVERIELRVEHLERELVGEGGVVERSEDVRMQLFVFGGAIDSERMLADLREGFPALAEAELHDVPLSGTVHGTLGGQLSHRFLDVTIDRHGVEEAERRVLAELVAQGVAPKDATVDITDQLGPDGERHIEVRIEAEHDERGLPASK